LVLLLLPLPHHHYYDPGWFPFQTPVLLCAAAEIFRNFNLFEFQTLLPPLGGSGRREDYTRAEKRRRGRGGKAGVEGRGVFGVQNFCDHG